MNRNSVYLLILLTFVWVILSEKLSLLTLTAGILISAVSVYYSHKYLPSSSITVSSIMNVNFFRFAIYTVFLIGQVYLAGLHAIKIIMTGEKVYIVEVKTKITNDFLKVILTNSITLTPGSVSLDLKDETITVLWLRGKKSGPGDLDNAGDLLIGKLEKKLLKAQR